MSSVIEGAQDAPVETRTFEDTHPELTPAPQESVEELLARACRLLGTIPAELVGASKTRSLSVAR